MRTQQRNKKLIYLCQKYQAGNITKYKPPIPIYENYAPTNSDSDLLSMGMDYSKRLRIKSDNKIFINGEWLDRMSVYHQGDRVYIYVKPPEEHDMLCKTADYEVETRPIETINQLEIMLFNRSGKN